MENPAEKIAFFCGAGSTEHDFERLYFDFESNLHRWTSAYETAHHQLRHDYWKGTRNESDSRVVSDTAKTERLLRAFCLGRFVELYKEDVRGKSAMQLVIQEVWTVQEWENADLLESILPGPWDDSSPDTTVASRTPILGQRFAVALETCYSVMRNGNIFLRGTFERRFATEWFWRILLVILVITGFAYVLRKAVDLMIAAFVDVLKELFLINPATRFLRDANAGLQTSLTSMADKISNFTSWTTATSQSIFAGIFTASHNATLAILSGWSSPQNVSRLQYTAPTDVAFPVMPFKDGILKAANRTIYMSQVAVNITAVPVLLSHARRVMLGASDIVRASPLKRKELLAAEYDQIDPKMDKLIALLRQYNSGVPDLFRQFGAYLSIAISRTEDVFLHDYDGFDVRDSPLFFFLSLHGAWWLSSQPDLPPTWQARDWSLLGAISFFVSSELETCITDPSHLPRDSFYEFSRSILVALTPGLGEHKTTQRWIKQSAATSLERFVRVLADKVSELYQIADDGSSLCIDIQNNFRSINILTLTSENEATTLLDRTDAAVENKLGWLNWMFSSDKSLELREAERATRIFAKTEIRHLDHVKGLHKLAYTSFLNGKETLEDWKSEITAVLADVHRIMAFADREGGGLLDQRDERIFWEDFKDTVKSLRPVISRLADAHER